MKKIEDAKLIEMLIIHGGVAGAASALGMSRAGIYKRLKDDAFRAEYDRLQGMTLSASTGSLVNVLGEAIDCLRRTMADETAPHSVRVSAADALLRHTVRYVESANILARIDKIEQAQENNETNNY